SGDGGASGLRESEGRRTVRSESDGSGRTRKNRGGRGGRGGREGWVFATRARHPSRSRSRRPAASASPWWHLLPDPGERSIADSFAPSASSAVFPLGTPVGCAHGGPFLVRPLRELLGLGRRLLDLLFRFPRREDL